MSRICNREPRDLAEPQAACKRPPRDWVFDAGNERFWYGFFKNEEESLLFEEKVTAQGGLGTHVIGFGAGGWIQGLHFIRPFPKGCLPAPAAAGVLTTKAQRHQAVTKKEEKPRFMKRYLKWTT